MKAEERDKIYWLLGFAALSVALFASSALWEPVSVAYLAVCAALVVLITTTYWMPKTVAHVIAGLAFATGTLLEIFGDPFFAEGTNVGPVGGQYILMWFIVSQYRKLTPPPAEPTADAQPPT